MLTYLPDDSDRCRVKELMASVRPAVGLKMRDPEETEQPRPPRVNYGNRLRPHKSMQT
jgi:hypothetical protein